MFRGLKGLRVVELKKIVKALEPAQAANYVNTSGRTSSHGLRPVPQTAIEVDSWYNHKHDEVVGPQKLNMRSDSQIGKFWHNNCKTVPISGKKVREHFSENEHIVCSLESFDMWIQIELFMVQGKY